MGSEMCIRDRVELLEFELHGGSNAEGKLISELNLPREVLIAATVRDGRAEIARGRTTLRKGDHVIVITEPQSIDIVQEILD